MSVKSVVASSVTVTQSRILHGDSLSCSVAQESDSGASYGVLYSMRVRVVVSLRKPLKDSTAKQIFDQVKLELPKLLLFTPRRLVQPAAMIRNSAN